MVHQMSIVRVDDDDLCGMHMLELDLQLRLRTLSTMSNFNMMRILMQFPKTHLGQMESESVLLSRAFNCRLNFQLVLGHPMEMMGQEQ